MKIAIGILLATSILFAGSSFEKNKKYTCLNTLVQENGVKHEVDMAKSLDRPFIFTIKGNQLKTVDDVSFDFKMEKGDMESYSNADYMLLLMTKNQLGLVPKKSKGQVQYFFQCKK